ncbi:hypothetical protein [Mycobacterium sp. UM_Kg27]|uniref:hypothetical protein n=1 Tax=Mycobacterium sp. UM_Kg27 TaxID=1545693 RepID=UPI00061B52A1|nr:hypothetical protein [Mycobacterium sp. UM_Kg27]
MSLLVPDASGKEVVDLFNFGTPTVHRCSTRTPPAQSTSPNGGALLNDLFAAAFQGNGADWSSAMTLFDDWLGIDPSTGLTSFSDAKT